MQTSNHSENHLGVLDEIVSISLLDNGVNPGVEFCELVEALLNLTAGLGVGVKVSWFLGEEVSSETLMSVQENSVDIVVELSRNILGKELNLIDHLSSLGTLGG